MKHWLRLHGLAIARTIKALLRHPFSNGMNLLVIGIAGAFPLALYMVISSVAGVAQKLPVEPQISVFLKTDAPAEAGQSLYKQLQGHTELQQVRFVPRDQALKDMQSAVGVDDLLAGLDNNPLPDAIVLKAKLSTPALQLERLQKELAANPIVDSAQLDSAWAQRLQHLLSLGQTLLQAVVVLLAVALVLLTGNAIRMQILTRHDEIEVAKLIGATDAFIRRPFFYFALSQGLLGGLIACGIVAGGIYWLNPAVADLAHAYGQQFTLQLPGPLEAGVVCGVTLLLCSSGAWLAVRKHLRKFH
ncbi:cell division transport system permease protein [Andreprevotia lacus DSM 23236]|jgi:cell division transport system permease protein|uniref:Cell division protein FtsX n=1 Tax=Andreprevotia lacus DSM 23236 TaxID=1121001 RepID=A0A1W1XW47_9NEIS|nr:permease-like cell division protein FtsX [Andreprevotia lacus]SMC28107.1 cell division transport system permease protein [Andreprevotia lacus DSM 23236]